MRKFKEVKLEELDRERQESLAKMIEEEQKMGIVNKAGFNNYVEEISMAILGEKPARIPDEKQMEVIPYEEFMEKYKDIFKS